MSFRERGTRGSAASRRTSTTQSGMKPATARTSRRLPSTKSIASTARYRAAAAAAAHSAQVHADMRERYAGLSEPACGQTSALDRAWASRVQ